MKIHYHKIILVQQRIFRFIISMLRKIHNVSKHLVIVSNYEIKNKITKNGNVSFKEVNLLFICLCGREEKDENVRLG